MKISVIIPTYNPTLERLYATLRGLAAQNLSAENWECVVVDNASSPEVDRNWCEQRLGRNLVWIREAEPGLSHARLAGIRGASAELIVFCDDDNVLDSCYLDSAIRLMAANPAVGVAGGKSQAVYLSDLPPWYVEGIAPLGCQDFGEEMKTFSAQSYTRYRRYPECAPIGAGMVFRKTAMLAWTQTVGTSEISDRKGKNLSSAGDCDMVLHALEDGYDVAYWPELLLRHLMPGERLTKQYLAAISRAAFRDYVRVLDLHCIRPWTAIPRWSVPLRTAKAWITHKAWQGPAAQIRWHGALGQFEGRATLSKVIPC